MEEYTNSTEMQEDVGLFDDYEPETTGAEETTDELEEQETPEVNEEEAAEVEDKPAEENKEPEKEPEKPQTLRVKYNGEENDISIEEATTLVQKGMNYDKVVSERNELRDRESRNSEVIKAVKMFADMSGTSINEYAKIMLEKQEQIIMSNVTEALSKEHPEWSDDAINEVATARANKQLAELKTAAAKHEEEQKQKELEPWLKLLDKYPEYKRTEGQQEKPIPPEVIQDVENGLTPIEAMALYEQRTKELEFTKMKEDYEKRISALEKNKKNKETALPSASGVAETPQDPFLEGLFS